MIRRLYQTLTGRPWTTTRSCTAEFGPTPAVRYAHTLAEFTDQELIAHGEAILTQLRQNDQAARTPA